MKDRKYWNPEIETMPLDEIKKLQLKKLRSVVDYAYRNNVYYHDKLKAAGVHPSDIDRLEDVRRIPMLSKEEMRETYPFGLVCAPRENWIELHSSSGTTGKPVVNVYTRKDIEDWSECMARNMWEAGTRPGDLFQCAYGLGLFTGGFGFYYGAVKIGAMMVPTSSGNTMRQITLAKDFGTTVLGATPSYALYLAEKAREMGHTPDDFRLKAGVFGAEAWSEEIRNKIVDAWGGPGKFRAAEAFGLTEVGGPGVSYDCEHRCGLHINADHFLVECVDKDFEPVAPGEKGELVITTLSHEGFPALRFRTKDLSYIIEDECECGRTLPRHARLMGRVDDMMKIKGVICFPRQIEEGILSVEGTSENYQIFKFQDGAFTNLRVEVEPTPGREKAGNLEEMARAISGEIMRIVGLRVKVDIVPIGKIPRSEGKAKRVVDLTK